MTTDLIAALKRVSNYLWHKSNCPRFDASSEDCDCGANAAMRSLTRALNATSDGEESPQMPPLAKKVVDSHASMLALQFEACGRQPAIKIAYMAHPYGGNPENLARAQRWLHYLNRTHFPRRAFVAPWIDWCLAVPETAENRAAGIALDRSEAARIGTVYLVGGAVTAGMQEEASAATTVVDLTFLGPEPPRNECFTCGHASHKSGKCEGRIEGGAECPCRTGFLA